MFENPVPNVPPNLDVGEGTAHRQVGGGPVARAIMLAALKSLKPLALCRECPAGVGCEWLTVTALASSWNHTENLQVGGPHGARPADSSYPNPKYSRRLLL
jgi:hypothetical protein